MKRKGVTGLLALILGCFLLAGCAGGGGSDDAAVAPGPPPGSVSTIGQYTGYSSDIYTGATVRTSHYVEVNNVNIAVDIYRPSTDGVTPIGEPLPVIYNHTSGNRRMASASVDFLVKRGYVVVTDDARGAGASFGQHRHDWSEQEALDAHEMIEWIATQSWCNGKVGLIGASQTGAMALMIAATRPPHLVSMMASVTTIDQFLRHPNGVPVNLPGSPAVPLPAPSVGTAVDEDPGKTMANAALAQRGTPLSLYDLFHGPYIYRNSFINRNNNDGNYYVGMPSISCSPITYSDALKGSGIKIYEMAGWYDQAPGSQIAAWKLWGGKVTVGPWTHQGDTTTSNTEQLRWFDYTLKGIQNGINTEAGMFYYTTNAAAGKEWRSTTQWPLPNQQRTRYYLGAGPTGSVASVNDGGLSKTVPAAASASDNYTVDYSVSVFNGVFKENRKLFAGDMTQGTDSKGLTYTTALLTADVQVTGHPIADIWVSTTSTDGDFHVFLEEVNGTTNVSTFVTNGIIRASNRALSTQSPWTEMGLPYHRAYDVDNSLLAPAQIVELTFDLFPTSYIFRQGNRIRFTITGSNFPTYEGLRETPAPIVTIYRDATHTSYIDLPVIPAQ
jgi:uncharacterized protein